MMESKIVPLGARVLVKRLVVEDQQTDAGILLPSRSDQPTYKNQVMAVGDEVTKPVSVGDVVLTTQFVGDAVQDAREVMLLVDERDLLAILAVE